MSRPFTIQSGEPDPLAPFLPTQEERCAAIRFRVKLLAELIGADLVRGPWIAGGAVLSMLTGDEPGDIDVFFHDEEQADRVEALFKAEGLDVRAVGSSWGRPDAASPIGTVVFRSTSYTVPDVGVVNVARTHMWPDVDALLRSFDFSVCQFATDRTMQVVHMGRSRLWCAANRILVPTRPTTRARVEKYLAKGYQLGQVYREAWAAGGPVPGLLAPEGQGLPSQIDPGDFI